MAETLALLLALLAPGDGPPRYLLRPLEGAPRSVRLIGAAEGRLRTEGGGGVVDVPVEDVFRLERMFEPPAVAARGTWLDLTSGDRIRVEILGAEGSSVRLRALGHPEAILVPLSAVHAVRLCRPEVTPGWDEIGATPAPAGRDRVLVRSGEAVLRLDAAIRAMDAEGLTVVWEARERRLPWDRLEGAVLANPATAPPAGLRLRVETVAGEIAEGALVGEASTDLALRLGCGVTVRVPTDAIQRLEVRGGRLVQLSDLDPVEAEETPWFVDNRWPWRRDACVTGKPLVLGGETREKGLGVHSRCRLTFALDGGFRRFRALVGVDDSAPEGAHATVQVLADEKPRTDLLEVRRGGEPHDLDLDVSGVERLTLLTDYGEGQDVGDRVDWVDARVVR